MNNEILLKKTTMSTTLPIWLHIWLKNQPGTVTHLIERALIEQYNLTPPKGD